MSSIIADLLQVKFPETLQVTNYVISSAEARGGSLFFALPGAKTDGHQYLEEVRKKGGVAAVVSKDYKGDDFGLYLIAVEDVKKTLQNAAHCYLKTINPKVIGITGSVGKTTTKEFIATLLEPLGKVYKTPGNSNSQLGLPVALLNAPKADYFVLEMGMSGKGEISKLIDIATPDISVITKVELVHAEFFPDGIEEIAHAKAEILKKNDQEIKGIFPVELERFEVFKNHKNKLVTTPFKFDNGLYFEYKKEQIGPLYPPITERHFLHNYVLAATVALEMGLSFTELVKATQNLKLSSKRFEKMIIRGITIFNDSYNASASSVIAALESLPKPVSNANKTIAVLGSMRELGRFSDEQHQKVGEKAKEICNVVLCVGKEAMPLVEAARSSNCESYFFENKEALEKKLFEIVKEGDVVLVKGSKSHELWKVAEKF